VKKRNKHSTYTRWFERKERLNLSGRDGVNHQVPLNLDEILKEIKVLRIKIESIGKVKELTDPDLVAVSQKLDAVLNQYYRLIK
jgi:hypothetical protein